MINSKSAASTSRPALVPGGAVAVGRRWGLALGWAMLGLCTAAVSLSATQSPEGARKILLASWESGGPAPLASEVAVYEDGTVVFRGMDVEKHRARLDRRDLVRLEDDLASSALT